MEPSVVIEDIQAMRRQAGVEDMDLQDEIRGLQIGDTVKLTFQAGPRTFETLGVRITSIRGSAFRGKLASASRSALLASLRVGSSVTFTSAHIHSVARKRQLHERRDSQTQSAKCPRDRQ
jgi:hypothetical protein